MDPAPGAATDVVRLLALPPDRRPDETIMSAHARRGSPGAEQEPLQPLVFYVDDDDALRNAVGRMLRLGSYRYMEASDARSAVEIAEASDGPIDVLLMDINLPDGWGASLAQTLREIHPEMVVVYTTGYAASDPILSGGLQGMPFVLEKPFEADDLTGIISRALERREGSDDVAEGA